MTATSSKFQALSAAIDNHSATIGIVGLGYVGLPLLLRCCEVGFRTIGFDTDSEKIDMLGAGTSFIQHIASDRIAAAQSNFTATTDFAHISECQAVILCVPTPLTKNRDPDLSYIIQTMSDVLPHLGNSPEREDPGRADFTTQSIPKLVAGHTPSCLKIGMALYGQIVDTPVGTSSLKVAEMAKILENVQRAVNIGLMNEMKLVADAMKVDIFEVIEAAATKPFGFTKYLPGPGLGGHCIPIDPFYLTWKAKEFGVHTQMIDVADQVNRAMPEHVIGKLMHGLNSRRKSVAGSKILLLGLAYKPNVDDSRESPSAEIMDLLIGLDAEVSYSDPHLPSFPVMRNYDIDMESVSITAESLAGFDAVIIATNHDAFDYDLIKQHAELIIDARGVYRTLDDKILRA